jgi:hypothetical protein
MGASRGRWPGLRALTRPLNSRFGWAAVRADTAMPGRIRDATISEASRSSLTELARDTVAIFEEGPTHSPAAIYRSRTPDKRSAQ